MTTNKIWLGLIAALSIAACSSQGPVAERARRRDRGNAGRGGQGGSATLCDGGAVFAGTGGRRPASAWRLAPPGTAGTGGRACETRFSAFVPTSASATCGGPSRIHRLLPVRGAAVRISRPGVRRLVGDRRRRARAGAAVRPAGGRYGRRRPVRAARRAGAATAAVGTSGGAPGGRGGTGGTTGRAAHGSAGGTGGRVDGGTDARACELPVHRPYICKRACGGPIVANDCCACEAPLFDDSRAWRAATAARARPATSAAGSSAETTASSSPSAIPAATFASTSSSSARRRRAGAHAAERLRPGVGVGHLPSECPTRNALTAGAGPVMGTATWTASGGPSTADVDLLVTLPGNDEALIARNVDVSPACP